jgi:hypothetical protein
MVVCMCVFSLVSNGKIYAGNPSVGRGRLDVARDTADVDCVENIFWTTPESGSFKVLVNNHMGPRAHYTVMLHAISPVKLMSKRGHVRKSSFSCNPSWLLLTCLKPLTFLYGVFVVLTLGCYRYFTRNLWAKRFSGTIAA